MLIEQTITVHGKTFDSFNAAADALERDLVIGAEQGTLRVGREVLATLQLVSKELARKHGNPWNGQLANDSDSLQSRSGEGLRSIQKSIKMTARSGTLVAGSISPAKMTVHETGATIRAKRSKFLTIPLPSAMDSKGVPLRKRARDWNSTFVARSRRGNLLIFQKRGKSITPLYLLKPSVRIRPRLNMFETLEGELPYFERRAFEALSTTLEGL